MQKINFVLVIALTIGSALSACSAGQDRSAPTATVTVELLGTAAVSDTVEPSSTATLVYTLEPSNTPQATATSTEIPLPTSTAPPATKEPPPFLLADPGPQSVGKRIFQFQDPSREGR